MSQPIIILAFADYGRSHTHHLRGLNTELDAILQILKNVVGCEVIPIIDATSKKIVKAFKDAEGPVIGFHFSGHGDGFELALQEDINGKALAHFLGRQKALQWVFLNSCASSNHAKNLLLEGINAVITTSRAILDEEALAFSTNFYNRLASFDNLRDAFEFYPSIQEMKVKPEALIYRDRQTTDHFGQDSLWELHIRPGAENVNSWNLLSAIGNPLLGLPTIPSLYPLPPHPFRSLERYDRSHAEVFFGRGEEILQLYKFVTADQFHSPILLLYGQSGVGKSSLLEAGLFPRIEEDFEVKYLRRDQNLGISAMLREELGKNEDVLSAWKAKEEALGKPIIFIFDQVEEIFTRPRSEENQELFELLAILKKIFHRPQESPNGKVILSFRKEYLADIQNYTRNEQIPFQLQPILPLSKAGIIEAISGINQSQRLHKKYGLQIEEGLAESIANELLEDAQSSIAPVLQILLYKLWELAYSNDPAQPQFTKAAFQKVKKEGILLEDFVEEKFQEIHQWDMDTEQSGLLLDLLMFHITELSTAEQRSLKSIKERYAHRDDVLEPLLQEVQKTYLLIDAITDNLNDDVGLRLIHDTLGPVIRKAYDQSQRDGQVASRIMANKTIEAKQNDGKAHLNESSLKMVEKGQRGMRKLASSEEKLIADSRELIQKQKRLKRQIWWGGGIAGVVLLVMLVGMVWQARQNSILENANTADEIFSTRNEPGIDPNEAMAIVRKSYDINPLKSYEKEFFQLYKNHIPYKVILNQEEKFYSMAVSPGGAHIATASKYKIFLFQFDLDSLEKPKILPIGGQQIDYIRFIDDNHLVVVESSKRIYVCSVNPLEDKVSFTVPSDKEINEILTPPSNPAGNRIFFRYEGDRTIYVWNWENPNQGLLALDSLSVEYTKLLWAENEDSFVDSISNPDIFLADDGNGGIVITSKKTGENIFKESLRGHQGAILATGLTQANDQNYLISIAEEDNRILLWQLRGLPITKRKFSFAQRIWNGGESFVLDSAGSLYIPHFQRDEIIESNPSLYSQKIYSLINSDNHLYYSIGLRDVVLSSWDMVSDTAQWTKAVPGLINKLVVEGDRIWVAGARKNDTLIFAFDRVNGDSLTILNGHKKNITSLRYITSFNKLLSTGKDKIAILWDLKTLTPSLTIEHNEKVEDAIWVNGQDDFYTLVNYNDTKALIRWDMNGQVKDTSYMIFDDLMILPSQNGFMTINQKKKQLDFWFTPEKHFASLEIEDLDHLNDCTSCIVLGDRYIFILSEEGIVKGFPYPEYPTWP